MRFAVCRPGTITRTGAVERFSRSFPALILITSLVFLVLFCVTLGMTLTARQTLWRGEISHRGDLSCPRPRMLHSSSKSPRLWRAVEGSHFSAFFTLLLLLDASVSICSRRRGVSPPFSMASPAPLVAVAPCSSFTTRAVPGSVSAAQPEHGDQDLDAPAPLPMASAACVPPCRRAQHDHPRASEPPGSEQ